MTARAQLALDLREVLPDQVKVIDHPTELAAIEGGIRAVVMLTRQKVAPAANQAGSFIQTFELVVIEPKTDQDGTSEDSLDAITDDVIEVLDALNWLTWSEATRATYDNSYPAYTFSLTLVTQKD